MADRAPEIVFYDGDCGLCHGAVKFILPRDRHGHFSFAPIGGETFARIPAAARADLPDSILVLRGDGSILVRSAATLHILGQLGPAWKTLSRILRLVPRPPLDWCYDRIARTRRRWFHKPANACPVIPPGLRGRLLA